MKKILLNEQKLLEYLNTNPKMTIVEVVELLDISEATARRLFTRLEEQGKIIRTYGGIQLVNDSPFSYMYEKVELENINEKIAIANRAVDFLQSNSTIYIDSGSTTAQFCHALSNRIQSKQLSDITVFTNSLINLEILSNDCKINIVGGEYRPHRKDFVGYTAEASINNIHFFQCFLGSDGYNGSSHFMTTDFYTSRLVEIVIKHSQNKILLADVSKFNRTSFVNFCNVAEPNLTVITNPDIPTHLSDIFHKNNNTVIIAE